MEQEQSLFKKYCMEGTILGLKYIYLYPDRLSRCFWIATLIALVYMAYMLVALLDRRFEEAPTRITIENQYEPILNTSFPAITICSPNQITISSTRHFKTTLVDGNQTIDLFEAIPQLLGYYEVVGGLQEELLAHLQHLIDANRYSALEVLGLLPQTCDDFIKMCFLQGRLYRNCRQLFRPLLTQHGMCCVFNSVYYYNIRKNRKLENMVTHNITTTGFSDALSVVTDYNPEDALDGTLLNTGATRVIYTYWKEFPAEEESNFVLPHSESFHLIHLTYTYCSDAAAALPASHRKCFFEDEFKLPYFDHFYNADCDLACDVKEIELNCNCTMVFVPNLPLTTACNFTSIGCIIASKLQMNNVYKADMCVCPRNCISYRYRVEMLTGNLDGLQHLVLNPYAGIVFNHSTSVMHFYVPSPVYIKQKQETVVSPVILRSNIGGIVGLCLGLSILSSLEILFFIYLAIKKTILRCRKLVPSLQDKRKFQE